jgi:pseudouridine synthase
VSRQKHRENRTGQVKPPGTQKSDSKSATRRIAKKKSEATFEIRKDLGGDADNSLRLNRAIAATGFCSRRKADEYIASGRVKVNGQVVDDFNYEVDPQKDRLSIDGKQLNWKRHVYIALYKPPGVVTTMSDERGRSTVMELLPQELRHLRPVGRLDMYSEGLLLMTNDGSLCQKLTHPVHEMGKLYQVSVRGRVANSDLTQLSQGIYLEDGPTLPAKVRLLTRNDSQSEFEITLVEGRNRQIRRMCSALGLPVIRLVRLGIGRIQLGEMSPGKWRYLSDAEVQLLFS